MHHIIAEVVDDCRSGVTQDNWARTHSGKYFSRKQTNRGGVKAMRPEAAAAARRMRGMTLRSYSRTFFRHFYALGPNFLKTTHCASSREK